MSEISRNITPEAIEESQEKSQVKKNTSTFDAKNYLNVRLDKNETEKSLKIRLLTIDKDSNSPFKHIHMHTVKVPKEISPSGWKSYVCLEKTEGSFSEKLGHKCPFCELKRSAYKKAEECRSAGDTVGYERYKEISTANIPSEVSIIRCIERGHEEDGPKFWKFPLRSDKKDPENMIVKLYHTKREECEESGLEPENILDIDEGRDLKVTIEAVFDKSGKKTNKTSVNVTTFGAQKPLSEDRKLRDKWVNDEKVWSDVFVAKPYEYLEVIIDGGIPWYDRESGKWIPKEYFEKNTGVSPKDVELDQHKINNAVEEVKETEVRAEQEEDLPF